MILDDGNGARSRQRRKEDSMVILGCERSGRRRNGHLKSLNRGNENKWDFESVKRYAFGRCSGWRAGCWSMDPLSRDLSRARDLRWSLGFSDAPIPIEKRICCVSTLSACNDRHSRPSSSQCSSPLLSLLLCRTSLPFSYSVRTTAPATSANCAEIKNKSLESLPPKT